MIVRRRQPDNKQQREKHNQLPVNNNKMKESTVTVDSLNITYDNIHQKNSELKICQQPQDIQTVRKSSRFHQQQKEQEQQSMNEIGQMLKIIYVTIYNQNHYDKVIKKYQQIQQYGDNGQFSIEGKLLQDIVQEIERLKQKTIKSKDNKDQKEFTKKQDVNNKNNLGAANGYYSTHYNHSFIKKPIIVNDKISQSQLNNETNKKNVQIPSQSETFSKNHFENQLKKNQQTIKNQQVKIKNLQQKIKQLEQKIRKLTTQSKQYKQQSFNLQRLNESKHSQISQLKKQLQQQEQFLVQQVTVIEELQKTLNESMMMESSVHMGRGDNNILKRRDDGFEMNVLDGLEEMEAMQRRKQEELMLKGRVEGLTQFLEEIQQQILRIQLLKHHNDGLQDGKNDRKGKLFDKKVRNCLNNKQNKKQSTTDRNRLNNEISKQYQCQQFQLSQIDMKNISNHRLLIRRNTNNLDDENNSIDDENNSIDDGIQQIQLSFCNNNEEDTLISERQIQQFQERNQNYQQTQQQQQQQLQQQQPSAILHSHIMLNDNNKNKHNINSNISGYLQSSMIQQYSFLSNNPTRYLQTIETMTQQLTHAYQQINILNNKLIETQNTSTYKNININNNNNININNTQQLLKQQQNHQPKYLAITPKLNNPQKNTNNNPTKQQNKKHKSFAGFNLSFWK